MLVFFEPRYLPYYSSSVSRKGMRALDFVASTLDGLGDDVMIFRDYCLQFFNQYDAIVLEGFSLLSDSRSDRVSFLLKEAERIETLFQCWNTITIFFTQVGDVISIAQEENPDMTEIDSKNFCQHFANLNKLHRFIRDPAERSEEMTRAVNDLIVSTLDGSDSERKIFFVRLYFFHILLE